VAAGAGFAAGGVRAAGREVFEEVVENATGLPVGGLPSGSRVAKTGAAGGERAGKSFTKKGKEEVIDANRQANTGATICEGCGVGTVPAQRSQRGVTPPRNETQVDHIVPRSRGGDGAPPNGQVLCRGCNRDKSDKVP
jgi:hypothetical protein